MLRIYDPSVEFGTVESPLAQRPGSLDGKVLGVLDNRGDGVGAGESGIDAVLEAIWKQLGGRYKIKQMVWRRKPLLNRVASKEIIEDLVRECDIVLNGTCQ